METMFWVWLAVIVICVVIEIVTFDLVSVWFAIGAVIPFILAGIGGIRIEIQIAVFVVVSALLIAFVRKLAKKFLFKNMNSKTNLEQYEGKQLRMLEECDFEHNGSVKINDVVWTAVSENNEKIEKDAVVEVVRFEGNKIIVKKIKDADVNQKEEKLEQGKSDKIVDEKTTNSSNDSVEQLATETKKEDEDTSSNND